MTHFGCLNVLGATTNMFDVPKVNVVNSSRMEDVDATIKKKALHGGKIIENNENNKTSSKSEWRNVWLLAIHLVFEFKQMTKEKLLVGS